MKTIYYLSATFFLVCMLASCSNDEKVAELANEKSVELKDILIKERSSKLPSTVKAPILYEEQRKTNQLDQMVSL